MSSRRLTNIAASTRGEAGFALPTVLLGLVAVFGLGAAMVSASLNSTSGVTRDTNTKSAFAVAEAGVSQALLRYNRFDTASLPCLAEGTGGQVLLEAPQSNGWCRTVTANTSGGSF